jgi:hypothetical protein
MISSTDPAFPNNVVDGLATRMGLIDADIFVTRRPLRDSDPLQSIGVFAALWTPNPDSVEMRGFADPGPGEPTLSRYVVTIQAFIKDADQERGMATHSVLSSTIRAILYRDIPLRTLLASLSVDTLGVTERIRRWGVTAQRFLNNELTSEWLYLSSIEMWVETETT